MYWYVNLLNLFVDHGLGPVYKSQKYFAVW